LLSVHSCALILILANEIAHLVKSERLAEVIGAASIQTQLFGITEYTSAHGDYR
jgi:hypothetical protein